ncbi:MAG: toll/interleukin-1 receptor domain-containing protein [Bacteroidota bacterium]
MNKLISQNNLEDFYKKEVKTIGKQNILEQIERKRNEGKIKKASNRTIFLSHSHLDKTIVSKIGLLFNKLDSELYVDWLDNSLPETPNKNTANAIKIKIQESKHFLFLATYHGLRSKWCNWELGIADSIVKENKLAILPIETKSGNWRGNEYLNLYPEMKFEITDLDLLTTDKIKIHQLDGTSLSLMEWLSI